MGALRPAQCLGTDEESLSLLSNIRTTSMTSRSAQGLHKDTLKLVEKEANEPKKKTSAHFRDHHNHRHRSSSKNNSNSSNRILFV